MRAASLNRLLHMSLALTALVLLLTGLLTGSRAAEVHAHDGDTATSTPCRVCARRHKRGVTHGTVLLSVPG